MMPYRLYYLDGEGRIGLAEWIDASNDSEAVAKARELKNGAVKSEIWQEKRLVAKLEQVDLSNAAR